MKIDIIGGPFTRKLTMFKNFPYTIGYFAQGQSLVSLFSPPYHPPVTMEVLDTLELEALTQAHRDLNKTHFSSLAESDSETLLIELGSELDEILFYRNSFFNYSSIRLLNVEPDSHSLSKIKKFRAFQNILDDIAAFTLKYDRIILIKTKIYSDKENEFLEAFYRLLESRVENILTVTPPPLVGYFRFEDLPLEYYDQINTSLKKLESGNHHNQLLFEEGLTNGELGVFVNYIGPRTYVYVLYKDGKKIESSPPVSSRRYSYRLDEPGKYRIRVHVANDEIAPRFSQVYDFSLEEPESLEYAYIELPSEIDWKVDMLVQHSNPTGLVGNPYAFPEGYRGLPVYMNEEVDTPILPSYRIAESVIEVAQEMDVKSLETWIEKIPEQKSPLAEYLKYVKGSKS